MTAPSDVGTQPELPPPGFYWAKLSGQSGWSTVEVTEANGLRVVDTIGWGNGGVVKEWGPALVPPGGGNRESMADDAGGLRGAYADAVMAMPAGAERRGEIRQMLIDLLDVVEQSADEEPLIAALNAYDEVHQ